MMLTDEEFRLFRNLIYEESGISIKDNRREFLENRLAVRMKSTDTVSPYWYYRLVSGKKRTELLILLDLLTINETSFFRNKPQMDFFRDMILPNVMRERADRKLRIWSAGCSTGEEPYSIAIIVSETVGHVRILASDISLTALETAQRGEYSEERVLEHVAPYYCGAYFEKISGVHCIPGAGDIPKFGDSASGDRYRVKEEIKKMVIFDYHNLKHDNGVMGLDIIFCRNVMIYFDFEEQKRLVNKFCRSLGPGGYLLTGHAESLHGWNSGFRIVQHHQGIAYKKQEERRCEYNGR
jgi:chemotaxis protein methyltransferase CheR